MASVEQVEAWQKEIEEKAGLPQGYTKEFSLVRFRREQSSRLAASEQTIDGPIDEFCRADAVIIDFYPVIFKLRQLFYRVVTAFH